MEFTPWASMRANSDAYVAYNGAPELNSKIYMHWSKNMFDQHLRTLDKSLDKMCFTKRSPIMEGKVPPDIMDTEPAKKTSQGIMKSLRNFFSDYMMQSQSNVLNRPNTLSITVFTNLGISPELIRNSQIGEDLSSRSILNRKFKGMALDEKTGDSNRQEKGVNTVIALNQFQEFENYAPKQTSSQKSLLNVSKRKGRLGKRQLLKTEGAKDGVNTLSEIEWSSTDDEKLAEERLKLNFKLAKKRKNRETIAEKAVLNSNVPSSSDCVDSEDSYDVISEPSKKRSSDSESICVISTDGESESDKDLIVMDEFEDSRGDECDTAQEPDDYMIPKLDHFANSESSENDERETKKRKESSDDGGVVATEILSSIQDIDFRACSPDQDSVEDAGQSSVSPNDNQIKD